MIQNDSKKLQKVAKNYECIICQYNTGNKTNYKSHLDTQKHYNAINDSKSCKKLQKNNKKFICNKCCKEYATSSNLFRHKKSCKIEEKQINNNNNNEEEEVINYKEMFLILINQLNVQSAQNKDLHNTIIKIIPKIGNNIINNTNNTNNVSIQVFLNDTCKDAMNITDFINTIQVSVEDLLFTKENGLIKGISNLFLSNLERIPMIQWPLWCSDKKRKRMFIKQDDWIEDINREKTNDLVNTISKIQTKNINKYIADKPNWMTNDKIKDNYIRIVKAVTDTMDNKIDKIIDNISDKIHLTEDTREKIIK